ncbi:uncharacterized protein N7483_011548 [Penicillium malachiteum]|uniref:uncharacterized protein n=1 Tax=Penicillium malachiteum TaxID=1324776 RepID=UPI002546FA1D|nr:uncharacterized protein N7483_011548 [Penicillium malachiteum]KAJ5714367.1 hypothetical protein N7483_011548 [Penicillium malachiteum]
MVGYPHLKHYAEHIQYGNLNCYGDPVGRWHRAHGDNKSSSGGKYHHECMKTSGEKPVFRIRVISGGTVAHGPVDLPDETQPSDGRKVDVLKELG